MNKNIIYILVIIALSISIILLNQKQDNSIQIYSVKKITSIIKTNEIEKCIIPIIINNKDSYFLSDNYINNVFIKDDSSENQIPLSFLDAIYIGEITYLNKTFYQYNLELRIDIESTSYESFLSNAKLHISYTSNELVTLEIGEFNYHYKELNNDDITLNNLDGVFGYIENINTLKGVKLTLKAKQNKEVIIKNISFFTNNVHINNNDVLIGDIEICDDYDHLLITQENDGLDINLVNETTLTIPFIYQNILYSTRLPIKIEYTVNNVLKEMVVDDFMFMSSNYFETEKSEYFKDGIITKSN
ncbi:hypothetical protein CI105_09060 [Candidatus Izimaplasma bacterium ZiA1]|uniref:hypothetical protein n=1 Tax=Candidatus Izimoplasma sp. ZiA1 TaxID=2024899 RepID=UPI000BAA4421|nr:hypothetical protein CI105_09060 [Candidatus Izimaplasma bacterium ZiA1]